MSDKKMQIPSEGLEKASQIDTADRQLKDIASAQPPDEILYELAELF